MVTSRGHIPQVIQPQLNWSGLVTPTLDATRGWGESSIEEGDVIQSLHKFKYKLTRIQSKVLSAWGHRAKKRNTQEKQTGKDKPTEPRC